MDWAIKVRHYDLFSQQANLCAVKHALYSYLSFTIEVLGSLASLLKQQLVSYTCTPQLEIWPTSVYWKINFPCMCMYVDLLLLPLFDSQRIYAIKKMFACTMFQCKSTYLTTISTFTDSICIQESRPYTYPDLQN